MKMAQVEQQQEMHRGCNLADNSIVEDENQGRK